MLTRRAMLASLGSLALLRPLPGRAGKQTAATNLIIVFAGGGWDTTWLFDPKPDSPYVDTGFGDFAAFGNGALWLDSSRPTVTDFFTDYGALTCVINGVDVPSVAHASSTRRILTGSRESTRPDIGAIIGHEVGFDRPLPYLDIGGGAHPGFYGSDVGYMGLNNQLSGLVLTDEAPRPPDRSTWERHFLDDGESALVRQFVEARAAREATVRAAAGANADLHSAFLSGLERSHALPDYSDFFSNVGSDRSFESQTRVGIEALAAGVCQTVYIDAGVSFDTHSNNDEQSDLYEQTFAGLLALMDTLTVAVGPTGAPLLDDTMVLVISEMGRTPMRNDDDGKDHWPTTSCMVIGGGVSGGQIVGATDDTLIAAPVDFATGQPDDSGQPIQAENVLAGILEQFGVPTEGYFPDTDAFRGFHA